MGLKLCHVIEIDRATLVYTLEDDYPTTSVAYRQHLALFIEGN